ncbi:hypothetical protein [Nonomuraea sp. NPDC023979]|uniref:hypothetical protein n=1 Tax=Nonomuraea sp. NPDC023979 TaxID=3154796 RepID=UPI0033E75820
MGNQIIRQPSGKYAIFSTYTDTIIVWHATEDEIVEYYAEEAAERARETARRLIGHVAAGEPRKAYHQFAMTWEEALAEDRKHHGDAWKEFRDG